MSRETLDVLLQFGPFAVLLVAAGAIVAAIIGAANAWAVAWFNARASRQVAIDAAHREYRKEWCADLVQQAQLLDGLALYITQNRSLRNANTGGATNHGRCNSSSVRSGVVVLEGAGGHADAGGPAARCGAGSAHGRAGDAGRRGGGRCGWERHRLRRLRGGDGTGGLPHWARSRSSNETRCATAPNRAVTGVLGIPVFVPPFVPSAQMQAYSHVVPRPEPVRASRILPLSPQWSSVTTYVPRFGPPITVFDGRHVSRTSAFRGIYRPGQQRVLRRRAIDAVRN